MMLVVVNLESDGCCSIDWMLKGCDMFRGTWLKGELDVTCFSKELEGLDQGRIRHNVRMLENNPYVNIIIVLYVYNISCTINDEVLVVNINLNDSYGVVEVREEMWG